MALELTPIQVHNTHPTLVRIPNALQARGDRHSTSLPSKRDSLTLCTKGLCGSFKFAVLTEDGLDSASATWLALISLLAKKAELSDRPWRVDHAISVNPRPCDAYGRLGNMGKSRFRMTDGDLADAEVGNHQVPEYLDRQQTLNLPTEMYSEDSVEHHK